MFIARDDLPSRARPESINMRITLEDTIIEDAQIVSIEVARDELKAQEVLQLVHRAMLAAGYHEDSISRYLPTDTLYEHLFEDGQEMTLEQFLKRSHAKVP